MPNQFFSPEGDIENYFVSEYELIDQYVGDQLWTWGNGNFGRLGNAVTTNTSTPVTTFAGGTNWKQIISGFSYTAAIKTDGTLWNWSVGGAGQLGNGVTTGNISTPVTTFAGGTNWKQVSGGSGQTAAIKTDGTLWTWGYGSSGRLGNGVTTGNISTPVTTFAGGTNWKQVSVGRIHTAAIKTDGTLWTWGSGYNGRLGNADTTNRSTPITTFAGGTNWGQVSCGSETIAAIKTDGTLWTWGDGGGGIVALLGTNDLTDRSTPITTFAGGTNWKQVSSGSFHTAAIKTDGTLWTWGNGNYGRLGRFSTGTSRLTPITTFAGGTNWADTATTGPEDLYTLSSGYSHTAAIKTDGTLWTWGRGIYGELGNNNVINGDRFTPVTTFAGGTNWKQISSGNTFTAAIKTDGTLWIWGRGSSGRLGNGVTTGNISTPVTTFAGGTNWKQVSSGTSHTAAIKTDGTLWTWGAGNNGILGNAVTTSVSTPVTTFAGGTNWKQVSTSGGHTSAIKTDGTLWTWGTGTFGRLGNAVTTNVSTPVTTFSGGTNWKQVISASDYTAAIKTDGTLWTWGNGTFGKLGNGVTTGNISTPVTTFAGGTNWKQVSAGTSHTAAIKTDGTLWTWGRGGFGSNFGRLGINDITERSTPVTTFAGGTNWKQVSSGSAHTIALKDDGVNKELYVFGSNEFGQLGIVLSSLDWVPNQTFAGGTNWKQASAGGSHTAAIKTDGTLWTWGNGNYGILGNAVTTSVSTPVTTFAGGTNWKQVSSGFYYIAAVQSGINPEYPLS